MEANCGPGLIFDRSTYGFLPDGAIVAIARAAAATTRSDRTRVAHRGAGDPVHRAQALRVDPATVIAGRRSGDLDRRRFDRTLHGGVLLASSIALDPATISRPSRSSSRPRASGQHALYYPPTNPEFAAPEGKPPLIVLAHGGPTSTR
jgi:hypothetical protein